jgi:hypothetical protein
VDWRTVNTYDPDEWVLIKIGGKDPHYKIFGSWRGGYLDGDSWRMNSGVVSHEEWADRYDFRGSSGSEYWCMKNAYGISSPYNATILENYSDKLGEEFMIFKECPELPEDFNWILEKS